MSLVSIHNEWDPLEEVIVGRAENARIPQPDIGVYAVEFRDFYDSPSKVPSGLFPEKVISEAQEDLQALADTFVKLGVTVRRPEPFDHSKVFSSPDWQSDGQYNYCPRDLLLPIGNKIIEAPMTFRARQHETIAYKSMLLEYMNSGAVWLSAPRPRLLEETYKVPQAQWETALAEMEPVFDAANVLRIGRDILYQISDTGNHLGAKWLKSVLGSEYRIHVCDRLYTGSHIDSTLTLVRPGLVVACAERVSHANLPEIFRKWDVIYFDKIIDRGPTYIPYATKWIGMNFMMVNPQLAIVERAQIHLIAELEKHGIDVIPLQLRHSESMGGGFHCVTVDVRRKGVLEDYC